MVFMLALLAWRYVSNRILNKKLQLLIDTKDKLFSIISHDLRSPFSVLIGYIEILQDEDLTENERKEIVEGLDQVTQNTYSLLENLLNLSASQRGDLDFSPQFVAMEEIIIEVKSSVAGQLKNKSLTLSQNLDVNEIYADRNMLEIIIRNLVTNAIKYSNINGIITVNSKATQESIQLSVADNGIGMDEETREMLFKTDFVKSQKGTAGEKGTGLGLSLCKEFVNKHNGTIKVYSQPGVGTEFIINLPTDLA